MAGKDDLLREVPDWVGNAAGFQAVFGAIGDAIDNFRGNRQDVYEQLFITTATWALQFWENELALAFDPNLSTEQRRQRILGRFRSRQTPTPKAVRAMANSFQNGDVETYMDWETYTLYVRFVDIRGIPQNISELQDQILKMVDANLQVVFQFRYLTVGELALWGGNVQDLTNFSLTVAQLKTWIPPSILHNFSSVVSRFKIRSVQQVGHDTGTRFNLITTGIGNWRFGASRFRMRSATQIGHDTGTRFYISTSFGQTVQLPSLQSWWQFNDYAGSPAVDTKGVANGTYASATQQMLGIPGNGANFAVEFNASGDYVSFGNNYSFSALSPFTLSIWIRPTTYPTSSNNLIVGKWHSDGTNNHGWRLYTHSPEGIKFDRYNGTGGTGTVSIPMPSINTWHLITVTYDGTNLNMYCDGALRAGPVASAQSVDVTSGDNLLLANGQFTGRVDELAIYNAALPLARVADQFGTGDPAGGAQSVSNRIRWGGTPFYVHGVNLAWINYGNDFGGGSANGASSTASRSAIDSWFSQAAAASMNVVRCFMFTDTTKFTVDGSGYATGFVANVYTDLDTVLELAGKYGLLLDLCVFDHPEQIPSSWRDTMAGRTALMSTLGTLFQRYANNDRIFCWEIGNEWDNKIIPGSEVVDPNGAKATIQAFCATVHANTNALACASNGDSTRLNYFVGLGLDFYQTHWFSSSGRIDNYNVSLHNYTYYVTNYGLDKPLIIGEFQVDTGDPALSRYNYMYTNGYAGAWGWSASPGAGDGMRIDWTAATSFGQAQSDLGPSDLRATYDNGLYDYNRFG